MRKLNSRQKAILDNTPVSTVDITPDLLTKLETINDYETLLADARRYLMDKYFKNLYGKRGDIKENTQKDT
jgi:hypothetical protein